MINKPCITSALPPAYLQIHGDIVGQACAWRDRALRYADWPIIVVGAVEKVAMRVQGRADLGTEGSAQTVVNVHAKVVVLVDYDGRRPVFACQLQFSIGINLMLTAMTR